MKPPESNASVPAPKVTAVIINYNGLAYLDELLTTLRHQSYKDFRTLLIDNASTDQSCAYVRNNYPWVEVCPQDFNLGFSRAGNLGVNRSRSEFVAFLNTDLKLDTNWLYHLVRTAEADPAIAAVASKLRLYDRPNVLNGVGGTMNYLGYTWDRGMYEIDLGQYDQSDEVLFASAGAALFRRESFLAAGGFDESFFMYHEDVDLCWRLWILGFRVVTAPQALVFHHFGGSTLEAKSLQWRELIGERNNIRSLIKNYELSNLFPALKDLILLPQPRCRKISQLRNFLWNLLRLPDTLSARRNVQKRRQREDRELRRLIVQSRHVPVRL